MKLHQVDLSLSPNKLNESFKVILDWIQAFNNIKIFDCIKEPN